MSTQAEIENAINIGREHMRRSMSPERQRACLDDNGLLDYMRSGGPYDTSVLREYLADTIEARLHTMVELSQLLLDLVLILHAAPRYDDEFAEDPEFVYRRAGTMTLVKKIDKACRSVLRQDGLLERRQAFLEGSNGRPWGTGLAITPKGFATAIDLVASDHRLTKFGGIDALETVETCLADARKYATQFMACIYGLTDRVAVLSKPQFYRALADISPAQQPVVTAALSALADWRVIDKRSGRYRSIKHAQRQWTTTALGGAVQ